MVALAIPHRRFHWECLKITDVSQLDPNHYICAQCLGGQGATQSQEPNEA